VSAVDAILMMPIVSPYLKVEEPASRPSISSETTGSHMRSDIAVGPGQPQANNKPNDESKLDAEVAVGEDNKGDDAGDDTSGAESDSEPGNGSQGLRNEYEREKQANICRNEQRLREAQQAAADLMNNSKKMPTKKSKAPVC
jgi:hypothetical protein